MQNPSCWARPGMLWCVFVLAACWGAGANAATSAGVVAHAVPTLDGFGLLVLATLLGVAVLWLWRRRQ